jgi:SNF2 family DNA or RNA helicase
VKTVDGIVSLNINGQKFIVLELMYQLLLEHQKSALDWLLDQYTCKFGSILADEMGLGKTITAIALLYTLHFTLK